MSEYKNQQAPGHVCPTHGFVLTVNESESKTVNPETPFIQRRLVCPGFFTWGCNHREKWTPEIEAELEAVLLAEVVNVEIDF